MLAVLAYRTAALLAGVLPAGAVAALARGLARVAFLLRVPARRALERNLASVQPEVPARGRRARARQAFESFALAFARFLRAEPGGRRAEVVLGREHLEAARASERGVIVLSAHLGDWEGGAAALAAEGLPVQLAAAPHRAGAIERLFARRRAAAGVGALPEAGRFAAFAGALRRRGWVALMADRGAKRSGDASVCSWAAALAERTGALVLPAVCVRDEHGRLALCIEPPLSPERCRAGAFRATMRAWLERWPGQWAAFERLPKGLA
jgi:KDO2-lipid IV(A) lauroyltransferase